jgi:hypothetical protein
MREALDLAGDGDELRLIDDLEGVFAIKFADAELEACRTAGDLNEIVWRHLSGRADAGNVRCMNAMALYALRRTLMAAGAGRKIRPTDRLDRFSITPRNLASALLKQTGLVVRFASGALGKAGQWAALAAFALAVAGLEWHGLLVLAPVLGLGGWLLMERDQGSFAGCETLADAAARLSERNFGKLVEQGARPDPPGVWLALCQSLSWHGNCPANEIGPATLLIHP